MSVVLGGDGFLLDSTCLTLLVRILTVHWCLGVVDLSIAIHVVVDFLTEHAVTVFMRLDQAHYCWSEVVDNIFTSVILEAKLVLLFPVFN